MRFFALIILIIFIHLTVKRFYQNVFVCNVQQLAIAVHTSFEKSHLRNSLVGEYNYT